MIMKRKRIKLNCPICKKEFERIESRVKRAKFIFCSKDCHIKFQQSHRIQINCDYCNKEIWRKKSHLERNNHNFCSRECEASWKQGTNHPRWSRVLVKCDSCSREFQIKNYKLSQKYNFCSRECKWEGLKSFYLGKNNPNWHGGYDSHYGKGWKKNRIKVLERDVVCQECKSIDNLCVHHIIPFKISNDNSLKNLITLCNRCHRKLESKYWKIEDRPKYFEKINTMRLL